MRQLLCVLAVLACCAAIVPEADAFHFRRRVVVAAPRVVVRGRVVRPRVAFVPRGRVVRPRVTFIEGREIVPLVAPRPQRFFVDAFGNVVFY